MSPLPSKRRDPRLAMQHHANPPEQHQHTHASSVQLLRWRRTHSKRILKDELSRSGAVCNVTIPNIDGRSAGMASVSLPVNADPNRFVSDFDGLPMFGKKLSVRSDHEATNFRDALNFMKSPPVPTNDDSTPPTKDTQADSNSPNWSLASQSEVEQPLTPASHRAPEPHLSPTYQPKKTKPWHSNKRPRTLYESDRDDHGSPRKRRFLKDEYSHRHFAKSQPNFRNRTPSYHHRSEEHRSSRHVAHSSRYMHNRDAPHQYDSREHTSSSRSGFESRSQYPYSRDRGARQDRSSSGSRRHKYENQTRTPYYAGRREHVRPHGRLDDVHREHGTPRRYSAYSSGKQLKSFHLRSGDRNDRAFLGGSRLCAGEYPAIVLRGIPSDINQYHIHTSFIEFDAIHVMQKEIQGLYHVLFKDSENRERALRRGCFTFSGVRITPEKCLTRIDRPNRPSSGGAPYPSPRTASDDRFVSSLRGSRQFEKGKTRFSLDSNETRNAYTNSNGLRQNPVVSNQNDRDSSRHEADVVQRGDVRIPHPHKTPSTEMNIAGLSESASHEIKTRNDGSKSHTCKTSRTERKLSSNTTEPVEDAARANPLHPSENLRTLSSGESGTRKTAAGSHPDNVQGENHEAGAHGTNGDLSVPENGFQSREEVFDAVLRHTIDRVSKQHAQLEMKRCEALVARSVFEFVSAKKAERKNMRRNESKDYGVRRAPLSANAFSEPGERKLPEASPRVVGISGRKGPTQRNEAGSVRKRARKSRFSDIPDPDTSSLSNASKALSILHSEAELEKEVNPDACPDVRQGTYATLGKETAHMHESEMSGSTVLKSSQESLEKSKTKSGTNAIMEESHGPAEKKEHASLLVEMDKDTNHLLNTDPSTTDVEMSGTESGAKDSSGKNQSSSLSVEKSDVRLPPPSIRTLTSELDKVLESKANYRHSKSSLLKCLHTDSGLPSLGLFSRQPPPKALSTPTPTAEASSNQTCDENPTPERDSIPALHTKKQGERAKAARKVAHATRSKSAKANVSTKKQSRKNGKAGKVKKEKKPRRAINVPQRKTKSSSSTVPTSPHGDQFELYIAPDAVQGTQAPGKQVDTSEGIRTSKTGVRRSAAENEMQDGDPDIGTDVEGTDVNVDDRDGKCARTEIYIRGQNKSKRRKRIHLESLSGKSALSSRQCRQESRLYRKGVSKIKPKNDDLINLNSLQQRWKKVQFDRSQIHGMGLYAKENIEPDEFVIEYIGDLIRRTVADLREKEYTRQGMGDSYLFRLNWNTVIDATRRGGIARFINHSCDPNVIARKITIGGRSTIAFYSKRAISIGEELTYDYKFDYEAEDKKISCLCGAANCRKYLN